MLIGIMPHANQNSGPSGLRRRRRVPPASFRPIQFDFGEQIAPEEDTLDLLRQFTKLGIPVPFGVGSRQRTQRFFGERPGNVDLNFQQQPNIARGSAFGAGGVQQGPPTNQGAQPPGTNVGPGTVTQAPGQNPLLPTIGGQTTIISLARLGANPEPVTDPNRDIRGA